MRVSGTTLVWFGAAGTAATLAYVIWDNWDTWISAAGDSLGKTIGGAAQAVNPVNPSNIFSTSVNKIVQAASGEPDTTLGVKLWEWLNPGQVAKELEVLAPRPRFTDQGFVAPATRTVAPGAAAGAGPAPDFGGTSIMGIDPAVSIIFGGGA